jgi:ABC-type glycerol-3-phosphate transport system substrate-binding protein
VGHPPPTAAFEDERRIKEETTVSDKVVNATPVVTPMGDRSRATRRKVLKTGGALAAAGLTAPILGATGRPLVRPAAAQDASPAASPAPGASPVASPAQDAGPIASPPAPATPVTIQVDGGPGEDAQQAEKDFYQTIVDRFSEVYPGITVESIAGGYNIEAFAAKVAGGTLEDGFGTFFTETQRFIRQGIVADVTEPLGQWGGYSQFLPEATEIFTGPDGKVYGFPTNRYALSLSYNRALFEQAGLDPNSPPATWQELRAAAKQIAEGTGTPGFAFLSTNNQGGWHFTTMLYTYGVDPVRQEGDRYIAQFNSEAGVQALQYLKDLRWTDNSMSDQALLDQALAQELLVTNQVAMVITGIPGAAIEQYEANLEDFGLGAVPQGGGNTVLGGGYGYMFNAQSTPDEIQAAIDWFLFRYFDPAVYESSLQAQIERGEYVGFPELPLFTGSLQEQRDAVYTAYANVPTELYEPYVNAMTNIAIKTEPTGFDVQLMYGSIDPAVQAVLTDENTDPKTVLDEATANFQQILDQG